MPTVTPGQKRKWFAQETEKNKPQSSCDTAYYWSLPSPIGQSTGRSSPEHGLPHAVPRCDSGECHHPLGVLRLPQDVMIRKADVSGIRQASRITLSTAGYVGCCVDIYRWQFPLQAQSKS